MDVDKITTNRETLYEIKQI